jgi:hypothetical protein
MFFFYWKTFISVVPVQVPEHMKAMGGIIRKKLC